MNGGMIVEMVLITMKGRVLGRRRFMDNLIYVIGIGEDGAGGLTPDSLSIVNNSEVLLGGERQLNFSAGIEGRKSCCKAG